MCNHMCVSRYFQYTNTYCRYKKSSYNIRYFFGHAGEMREKISLRRRSTEIMWVFSRCAARRGPCCRRTALSLSLALYIYRFLNSPPDAAKAIAWRPISPRDWTAQPYNTAHHQCQKIHRICDAILSTHLVLGGCVFFIYTR